MRADELRFLPAVRRLQRSGVTFTSALSADSLCCPARATLLDRQAGTQPPDHRQRRGEPRRLPGVRRAQRPPEAPSPVARQPRLPDGVDRQVPERDPRRTPLPPARLDVLRRSGARDLRLPRSAFAINGRYPDRSRATARSTRGSCCSRGCAHGHRPPTVLRPLQRAGPPQDRPRLGGTGRRRPACRRSIATSTPPGCGWLPSVGEVDMSDKPAWLQDYVAETGLRAYPPAPRDAAGRGPAERERHRPRPGGHARPAARDPADHRRLHLRQRATCSTSTTWPGRTRPTTSPCTCRSWCGARASAVASQAGATVSLADVTATIRRAAGREARPRRPTASPSRTCWPTRRRSPAARSRSRDPTALYPHRDSLPIDPIGRFYSGAVWGPYTYVQYQTGDREFYDRTTDPWQMDNTYAAHPTPGSPQAAPPTVVRRARGLSRGGLQRPRPRARVTRAVTPPDRAEPPAPGRRTPYPRRVDTTTKRPAAALLVGILLLALHALSLQSPAARRLRAPGRLLRGSPGQPRHREPGQGRDRQGVPDQHRHPARLRQERPRRGGSGSTGSPPTTRSSTSG